ncbi:hypothetical protein [Pseudarthrobacter sp. NS4]|uniref:hypothetical protein n=1 Tax=Pseudarthrobacter sp. NS4 TaxID=2973976 RepID=UPI002162922A|nr:hypothetical protein [Pseudarthrobacter sp. NS4]
MGTVLGVAWSLMMTTGGAAVAAGAPFGAAGMGGQYLAGHVLLGLGLGQLLAMVLRSAARRILRNARPRPVGTYGDGAVQAPEPHLATVTVLPVRQASVPPLRGRHAA